MRIRPDQALHRRHGLFGAAKLVVRPRHLVQDLVAVLVARIVLEELFIKGDRLERTRRIRAAGQHSRPRGVGAVARRYPVLRGRALLEVLIGFARCGAGGLRGQIGRRLLPLFACLGGLRGGHRTRLAVARTDAELLLELQVRKATHRFRRHLRFGRLFEKAPVALHGLIEALLDRHLLQVRVHVTQLRQRLHLVM
jgi:hypothetical protein